jgi:predicted nucleotidyltransferase
LELILKSGPARISVNRIERIVVMLRRWAEKKPEIEGIAIFGSFAKGTTHSASDLDLFIKTSGGEVSPGVVIGEGDKGFVDVSGWKVELRTLFGIKVHIGFPDDPKNEQYARQAHLIVYDPKGALSDFLNKK